MYTNEGLVKHAEKALKLRTKYMWGGILRPIEQQYDTLFKMYGNKAGTGYTTARWNELSKLKNKGVYAVDCVGLIKSYYWSGKPDGGVGSPRYGAVGFPDVNAGYMYQTAKVKGKTADMPDVPGLIVYSKTHPHVGIYVGNGETIESTYGSRGDGVVKRKLDNFWEYWFECPYIEYTKTPANPVENPSAAAVGKKIYIRKTAKNYTGTNIAIPSCFKGSGHVYTAAKVMSDRVLIKELYSWVDLSDTVML